MLCASYLPKAALPRSSVVGRRAATAAGERSHTDRVIRKDVARCVDEVDLEEYPLNVGDAVGVLWL